MQINILKQNESSFLISGAWDDFFSYFMFRSASFEHMNLMETQAEQCTLACSN